MGRKPNGEKSERPSVGVRKAAKDSFARWCLKNDEEMSRVLSNVMVWFAEEASPLMRQIAMRRIPPELKAMTVEALREQADQIEDQAAAGPKIDAALVDEREPSDEAPPPAPAPAKRGARGTKS